MAISVSAVKALREQTGAGVMDCKRALEASGGDMDQAAAWLRQQGLAIAAKKTNRLAAQGLVESYIHAGGRIGVLVEVNCETDFVARTSEFKELAHNLAMQIAATAPRCISPDETFPDADYSPPESCLLTQPFIRDPDKTVRDVITETIAKVGENIQVRRFSRFELGN